MWSDEEETGGKAQSSSTKEGKGWGSSSEDETGGGFDDCWGDADEEPEKKSATAAVTTKAAWEEDDSSSEASGGEEEEWWDSDEKEAAEQRKKERAAAKAAKQTPGVSSKKKQIVSKKQKLKLILQAQKKAGQAAAGEEDPDEDPQERKRRIAEQQRAQEAKMAEELFGLDSDDDDDDDDDSGDGIDRSATTGDPDFMAADMDFDDMGAMGGPKVETLDLRSIKLKGKPEIDKIVAAISEILSPYRNNLPFFNVPVAMVVALADAEGINATVSELNRMSREKAARIKVMKGRKAPKRADVKAAPKTASSSSAKPRGPQKPIDFWTYTPVYLEDYEKWGGLIADGLRLFSRSSNFNQLILALTRDWCSHLEPDEIRRVVQPLNRRANDMLEATKPKKKVSTKASLVGASGKRGDDGMKTYDEAFTADY